MYTFCSGNFEHKNPTLPKLNNLKILIQHHEHHLNVLYKCNLSRVSTAMFAVVD